ncbi:MAG: caspase family protein [Elusimicrobia bacterium]|nr:caspase family protein [Elusimicrobiota bacterium]
MKTFYGLLAAAVLFSGAPARASEIDYSRAWVFAVGIIDWPAFPASPEQKAGRRDRELMEFLAAKGVSRERIVFLTDRQASTTASIRDEFRRTLARTKPGDFLFLYYAGEGDVDARGRSYFMARDRGAWTVQSIFHDIERDFKGARAILAADCCYSGGLAVEAGKLFGRVSYFVLSSVDNTSGSTGEWTFTEALLAGLRGEPAVDLNRDGRVKFEEWAEYIQSELAFNDDQISASAATGIFGPGAEIARTSRKLAPRESEHVEVPDASSWRRARVIEARRGRLKVRYSQKRQPREEWVDAARARAFLPPPMRPIGQKVLVEYEGKWLPAVILKHFRGVHRIRYDDPSYLDEWVEAKRIKDVKFSGLFTRAAAKMSWVFSRTRMMLLPGRK